MENLVYYNISSEEIVEIKKQYGHLIAPRIIAFDLDMTLHDIIEFYEENVNKTRIYMGLNKWTDKDFRELHKEGYINNKDSFKMMFGDDSNTALQYYYDLFHNTPIPQDRVFPGVRYMLDRIKNKYNLKIIGVTNSEQHIAKKVLRDLNLFTIFDSITGPKGNRKPKPETELLQIGLNKIGESFANDIWLIGDSSTDTMCASKAGCVGIRFYQGEVKPADENADAFCNCHFKFEKIIGVLLGYYK